MKTISDVIERIEKQIIIDGVKNNSKFEKRAKDILDSLNDNDGDKFERGHQLLGELLGYNASNSTGSAEPDPWWIINDEICIVSEDKIYQSEDKPIPPNDVKQADGHKKWIKEKITYLTEQPIIETVMITTANKIESAATTFGDEIWYINRKDFVEWARKAIDSIRKIRRTFVEEGNLDWRANASNTLIELKVTPKHYLEFIRNKKLKDLETI